MKIRTLILSSLSAAALLASCSNDSVVADSAQLPASNAIKFNTTMANITKSTVYSTGSPFNAFKVTALKEESSGSSTWNTYFSTIDVTKNAENKWVPSSNVTWPSDNTKLRFYAYVIPTGATATINSSSQSISYTTPSSTNDQFDLMTAFKEQGYSEGANNTVTLKFKHALSQIKIQAKNASSASDNYSIDIAAVKIGRVKDSGTLTYQTTENTPSAWTTINDSKNSFTMDLSTNATLVRDASFTVLTGSDQFLMIPQQLEEWNKYGSSSTPADNNGSYIAFKCKITKAGTQIFPAPESSETYGWTAIPIGTKWEAGYSYTYSIEFFKNGGAGNKEPEDGGDPVIPGTAIDFDVDVANWTDASGTPITLNNE